MIRVATVFSGIGAIEHALLRMDVPHEIVFACDNGDVDVLSKKVDPKPSSIETELSVLNELLTRVHGDVSIAPEYEALLAVSIDEATEELQGLIGELASAGTNVPVDSLISESRSLAASGGVSATKRRALLERADRLASVGKGPDMIAEALSAARDIELSTRKLRNDGIIDDERSEHEDIAERWLEGCDGARILKRLRHTADSLSMLHERLNTIYIKSEIDALDDPLDKKRYVDSLYGAKRNPVRDSYLANYELNADHFHWNASFLDGKGYQGKVDLLVGGSPCQSFSLVGKQRGLDDTRGTLFYEFARLVSEVRPKVFIFENVRAVLSNDSGDTWGTMSRVFDGLGYQWSHALLNAKDFGIPQNRERLFVVGFRNDLSLDDTFSFPNPVPLTATMQDYLLDSVSSHYYLGNKGASFVTKAKNLEKRYTQIDGKIQLCQKKNQQFNWHGDFVFVEEGEPSEDLEKYYLSAKVTTYVLSSGTKTFVSRPKTDLSVARPLLTTMHKMHRAGIDNYVTTQGRLRKLTPRECLRLMGFCDSFQIVVSDTAMYQQAGNSIVVDVLIAVMDRVLNSLTQLAD